MCEHEHFKANVNVNRLTGKPQMAFTAEVTIECSQCGKKFQFLGLQPGMDTQGARCSLDGLEAVLAICPEGEVPNPFQRLAYGIERHT